MNLNKLWKECISYILIKYYNNNEKILYAASEKNKQIDYYPDIKSWGFGICHILSIYKAYKHIIPINLDRAIDKLGSTVNQVEPLIEYLNDTYCTKTLYKFESETFEIQKLKEYMSKLFKNNYKPVFYFFDSLKPSLNHAMLVYKLDGNIIGYIENANEYLLPLSMGLYYVTINLNESILKTSYDIDEIFVNYRPDIDKWIEKNINILDNDRVEFNIDLLPPYSYGLTYLIRNILNVNLSIYDRLTMPVKGINSKHICFGD